LRQLDEAENLALAVVNDATPRTVAKRQRQAANASNVTADALVLLGVIRAVRLDNAGALRYTQRAVALAPDNFDAHLALGRAFYGASDPANAAVAFRQAIKVNSTDVKVRFFLATALEKANDLEGALVAYRELLQVAPQNADGHLGLGVLLVKQGGAKVDEGIQTLARAVNLNGDLYEARITLGRALVRAGRAAESVEHLQRAAALAPGNPEPRYQLAIAYRRLGKKIEAEEESRIVKQLHEARRGTDSAPSSAPKPN
jgi:cytochrome c-type biogenesis protein CcmH/NrfG